MTRLEGKVALVTGAASGIGHESAILFAANGAKVACVDTVKERNVATAAAITSAGGSAISLVADVSKAGDMDRVVATTVEEYGALHVAFNNAGIMHPDDGNAVDTEESIWDLTMGVNAKGVFFGCKYEIPAMLASGGGSIINTASFVAVMGSATSQIAYTASKGAVQALTRELAIVHARQNIRVNSLCPGPLRTDLLMNFLDTTEKKDRRLVHITMGRFGEASEMAEAALWLASNESSYVTGTDLMVDGGLSAAYVTPEA